MAIRWLYDGSPASHPSLLCCQNMQRRLCTRHCSFFPSFHMALGCLPGCFAASCWVPPTLSPIYSRFHSLSFPSSLQNIASAQTNSMSASQEHTHRLCIMPPKSPTHPHTAIITPRFPWTPFLVLLVLLLTTAPFAPSGKSSYAGC